MTARTTVESRQNAALPIADLSSPRDEGNIIQADATNQQAGLASHNLSGGNSTGTELLALALALALVTFVKGLQIWTHQITAWIAV